MMPLMFYYPQTADANQPECINPCRRGGGRPAPTLGNVRHQVPPAPARYPRTPPPLLAAPTPPDVGYPPQPPLPPRPLLPHRSGDGGGGYSVLIRDNVNYHVDHAAHASPPDARWAIQHAVAV